MKPLNRADSSDLSCGPAYAYRPDIDGLRALAIGTVILYHLFPETLGGGFLGVDVFFVISGFLITGMIIGAIREGRFSLLDFYLRRARRIVPALLVMLVGTALLAVLILMPDEMERFGRNVTAGALFVPNLLLAREQGYSDAAADDNPLLHLWSLGVEEQFYLLWPAAMLVFVARGRARTALIVTLAVGVVSLAINFAMERHSPNASFYLPFTRFWQLLAGGLLATLAAARVEKGNEGGTALPDPMRSRWSNDALSFTGLALIGGAILAGRAGSSQVTLALPATIGAALFIAAGPNALPNRTLFSWRPVVYLGLISYPLYLWHWPPLSFLQLMDLDDGASGLLFRLGAVAFAAVAAVLTYHLVELPIRRRKDLPRIGTRLMGGLGAAAVAGIVVVALDGLPQRTDLDHNPFYRTAEMRRDDRCSEIYGQPRSLHRSAFCVRTDYDEEPEIVLLGDSHSNMFVSAIQAAYPASSTLQIGASACTYLRNTEFWNDNRLSWRRNCPPLTEAAYRGIGNDTRLVILSARMTGYVATPEEFAESFDYVSPHHFQSPEFPGASPADTYRLALVRDLRLLLENDREVILVLPVPALDFSPRTCVRLRPIERWRKESDADACTVPRAEVEAEHARSRAIVAQVAREIADPDLHVVDPVDALCDAHVCHAVVAGRLMYRDDNHLSPDGSRLVWSRIEPRNLRANAALGWRMPNSAYQPPP